MALVVLWAVLKIPVMSPGDTPPRCDETGRVTELASSLGKALLLCDVTTGQWYKRAPSDQTFTPLSASTFPMLHPRRAVLGIRSLPLHHLELTSLFQRTRDTMSP